MIYHVIALCCAVPWALAAALLCAWLHLPGWIPAVVGGVVFFAALNIQGMIVSGHR